MTARLVLHVGLPKCGSSALQTRMASNRERALALGVFYPEGDVEEDAGLVDEDRPMAHMRMAGELVRMSRSGVPGPAPLLNRYVDEFRASGAGTLFLSSESLCERLQKIRRELLAPLAGFRTDVVIFYRRADALALSAYKQAVRRRRYTESFQTFVETGAKWRQGVPDLTAMLAAIRGHFPGAILHIHDLSDPEGSRDTIAVAGAILHLPLSDWPTTALHERNRALTDREAAVNASHDDEKTLYLRALNRTALDEETLTRVDIALTRLADRADAEPIMNRRDSRDLLRMFATVNAGVVEHGVALIAHDVDRSLPRGPRRADLARAEVAAITERLRPLLPAEVAARLEEALRPN